MASEHAHGIPSIAPGIVQPPERPRVAVQLLGLIDTSKGQSCRTAGVVGRQPATSVLVFEEPQVRRDLTFEVRFLTIRVDGVDQSPEDAPQAAHHSPSFVSKRFTRSAERCHQAAWSARARVPDRVIA